MVDYSQPAPDVWGAFAGGMQIGGALRQRQQQREYGQAYQQTGWEGVRDTAGGYGDLETAQGAQGVMDNQQETAIARAQRSAEVLSNAATSLMGMPYEQRMARVQQMAPMLSQMGIDEAQLSQFDPTDENLASIRAIQGQFSQFTDIRQQGDAIVGVRPDGSVEVLRQEAPQAPQGYRMAPDGQSMQFIPGGPADPANRTQGGGSGGRAPPSGYEYDESGQRLRPIPGGPRDPSVSPRQSTFGPDQRARAAITYQNALESAQTIDGLEDGGYSLSDDWGAVGVEGMGGGDPNSMAGAVARNWGGADYQQARAAMSSFESAMLPILSGAAVTESEAIRTIRGALPQVGDGPEVAAQKRRRRQQMLNGAALIYGTAPPYPELGVPPWAQRYLETLQGEQQSDAMASGIPDGVTPEEWEVMTPEEQALFTQ